MKSGFERGYEMGFGKDMDSVRGGCLSCTTVADMTPTVKKKTQEFRFRFVVCVFLESSLCFFLFLPSFDFRLIFILIMIMVDVEVTCKVSDAVLEIQESD